MTPIQQAQVDRWQKELLQSQSDGDYTVMSILIIRLDTLEKLGLL
jgi:hypothetical protein